MNHPKYCPKCGALVVKYSNPYPTADVIIYDDEEGIVLIERKNKPLGFAIPGGFIEEGESAEHAAYREMQEEIGINSELIGLLGVYSCPTRDLRVHTITTVFVGRKKKSDTVKAGDDASAARFYQLDNLPETLCFDHARVIEDFKQYLAGKRSLLPCAEDPLKTYDEIIYTGMK